MSRARGRRPRRGLVLGAGGVLGFAWAVGALSALQDVVGFDCRDVDMLVGTSAGSVTASLLACRVPVEVMVRHQLGTLTPDDPRIDYDESRLNGGGRFPPRPGLRMGSPALLMASARNPSRFPPLAALSSVLPLGRGSLAPVHELVSGMAGEGWAPHRSLWVVAMDYDSGRRVPFGRPSAPDASLADAVTASCAIPAWFAPVTVGGRRYVDGGMCSATSVDLLAGAGLDEVFVVAPLAATAGYTPSGLVGRLMWRWRRAVSNRLAREVAKVRAAGTTVTVLSPGAADLVAIGPNMMDPSRRVSVVETAARRTAETLRGSAAAS